MRLLPFIMPFLLSVFTFKSIVSQDIQGISIQFEETEPLKYETKAKLFCNVVNAIIRPYVIAYNGLSNDTLWLTNTEQLSESILLNEYVGEFIYPSPGEYIVQLIEGNRTDGISNIENSIQTELTLNYKFFIIPGAPSNTHPIISGLHSNIVFADGTYTYDPLIEDLDGDSIGLNLIDCLQSGYTIPQSAQVDTDQLSISLAPATIGKFSICAEVEEWRNGVDQQILLSKTQLEILFDLGLVAQVEESIKNFNIQVVPNPSHGSTVVNLPKQEPTKIFIFNLQGKLMKELQANTREVQIELPDQQGEYLVQVVGESYSSVVKVVKE